MQAIQYMQIAGVRKIAAAIINALKPHGYVPRWNLFMLCQQMEEWLLGVLEGHYPGFNEFIEFTLYYYSKLY